MDFAKLSKKKKNYIKCSRQFLLYKSSLRTSMSVDFLHLKELLAATFNDMNTVFLRYRVAEEGTEVLKLWEQYKSVWSHSSILASEKWPIKLSFQSVFNSKITFGSYIQRNACTYFQKIRFCVRCKDLKHTNYFDHTPPFLPQKKSLTFYIFRDILYLTDFVAATFNEITQQTSRK